MTIKSIGPLVSKTKCQSCVWEQKNWPSTTSTERDTMKERRYRRVKQIEQAAQEGCWTCGLFLAAVEQFWVPIEPEIKTNPGELYLRYDAERFTIHCQTKHPPLQIYSTIGQRSPHRWDDTNIDNCLTFH